jgi:hypothetical protein
MLKPGFKKNLIQKILLEGGSGSGFASQKNKKKSKKAKRHGNCNFKWPVLESIFI